MLDFYQNLNINSGLLQDQCPEKNSLGCGQAGKLAQTRSILDELRRKSFSCEFPLKVLNMFPIEEIPQRLKGSATEMFAK
jgi:hypothetical protein